MHYSARRSVGPTGQRSVVMSRAGMVAASQPLAALSGYRALARGGNAVDAAVAMLATLSVVEPHSVGIGGDAFALIYLSDEGRLLGLNGSGRAPLKATRRWFIERGFHQMPESGILSVTVPGALDAWNAALERCGRLGLAAALEDAILYAQEGFPVTEVISGEWRQVEPLLRADPAAACTYLVDGKAPRPGQVFRNPDLARTYERIQEAGGRIFYEGEVGEAIARESARREGLLERSDLEAHHARWVEPIHTCYRGYTVYELPPNGQGVTALQVLNIMEGFDLSATAHSSPGHLHPLIEALKIAFVDRDTWVADPDFEPLPLERLLSKAYAADCRRRIDSRRAALAALAEQEAADTVYVSAVDAQRNAASFISSIFMPFGSGVVVDGTGIVLQNRGRGFTLQSGHPNRLAPGKRPLHTIIPGMLFHKDRLRASFGVMGGDMQPQGHAQFLINLIDFDMNPQAAMDAPRVRYLPHNRILLEAGIPAATAAALADRGHEIVPDDDPVNPVGGGQAVLIEPEADVLLGASDRRKDGLALGC